MNELLDLYWTFVKIGCVTFGGGYAMLPILEEELANKRNWTNLDAIISPSGSVRRASSPSTSPLS